METVKVRHLGREEFNYRHGNVRIDFAPGEEKEVPAYVAEELLREQTVERKWKKDGKLAGTRQTRLFEEADAPAVEKVADEQSEGDGEQVEGDDADENTGDTE